MRKKVNEIFPLLVGVLVLSSTSLFAQTVNIGHIYGKVLDKQSNKPLEAVSVQFLQRKIDTISKAARDSIIAGTFTNKRGEFSLQDLPIRGGFHLQFTMIGYRIVDTIITFGIPGQGLAAFDKDFGNLKLEQHIGVLEQVTVTGTTSLIQFGIDRKIFNVERNINSVGGTAVEVMRTIPLVSVDIDGNVTLRNSTPQIFLDGKPSSLTLDQIPADAIQSVELITNPSARFDASGVSGIINIVLKKNRRLGYNGSLRAGIDSRLRTNLGGDISIREGKINLFANGNFGQRKTLSTAVTDRITLNVSPASISHQEDNNEGIGYAAFGRLGFDYFMDNRNTITVAALTTKGEFKPTSYSNLFYNRYGSGTADTLTQRLSRSNGNYRAFREFVSFKHNFPKPGKELTADLNFNQSRTKNSVNISSTTYAQSASNLGQYIQLQDRNGVTELVTIQSDYADPLTEKSKIEVGIAVNLRNVNNKNVIGIPGTNGEMRRLDSLSSDYINKEQIYAAYTVFSNQHENFGYQLGIRIEGSDYIGKLKRSFTGKDTMNSFSSKFPFSLFPSVFLTQKLNNSQEIQLNYTRRINRPIVFQLSPFIDFTDSLNLSQGNPRLQPEFTNSFELSYQKLFKRNNSLLLIAYLKSSSDLISRYAFDTLIAGKRRIINSYINANSGNNYGFEIVARDALTKWWDMNANVNFFSSKINFSDPNVQPQRRLMSYLVKLNNTFKLPKNFTFQLSGDYTSKSILPPGGRSGGNFFAGFQSFSQGYLRPNYGIDASIRYDFLKEKKASISVSINDIFKTRKNDVHSESQFFVQDSFRQNDAQIVRLNFNWRFGKVDATLFKRKNIRAEQDAMQGVQSNN